MIESKRKFWRTVIQIEVLSEEPYDKEDLIDISHDCTDGDCSGQVSIIESQTLTGAQAAKALMKQGSSPSFFCLTEDGKDDE
jgi:hypothetical protein